MTTHEKLMRAIEALGATIDEKALASIAPAYQLDAPSGEIWAATRSHTIAEPFSRQQPDPLPTQAEAARRLLLDVADGLVECDEIDCDACAERAQK